MYLSRNNEFDLRVAVVPKFQTELSSKYDSCWEYSVFIENNSGSNIELIDKFCQIIYANGTTYEILGFDEDDDIKIIEPGVVFESRSLARIKSSSAIIKGHYVMFSKGEEFDVEIPAFSLDNPYHVISIN